MITDYSSVFFDFAYLKKPLIYYQPEDDYHYEDSYFDFDTMGFGDVIHDKSKLLDKIEYYIKNNCNLEKKYMERVDNFFKYTDRNNSKRVYDWILKH
jgi:CDP-glycerol glycerophosphotransferase (TagB/SpsB family)